MTDTTLPAILDRIRAERDDHEQARTALEDAGRDSKQLLACPFCGSDDIDESFVRGYERGDQTQPVVGAGCMSCGAAGPTVRVPDHSAGYTEVAAKWNTRAT